MYKALCVESKEEITILDPKWDNRMGFLRSLDRKDLLVCQGCLQPLRVKSGILRRPHFAHKHLLGCSYGSESPEILNARAVLYKWLLSKFSEGVSLEKKFEKMNLPRPVDCWVSYKNRNFAYWIIDSGMKYQSREKLLECFRNINAHVSWVFTYEMLHFDPNAQNVLHLSPTERNFLKHSEYDEIIREEMSPWSTPGNTIHYLDAMNEKLISFRSVKLNHSPNVFTGYQETNQLSEMKISRLNGEFVHPEEHEKLLINQNNRKELNLRRREEEEVELKRKEEEVARNVLAMHSRQSNRSLLIKMKQNNVKNTENNQSYATVEEAICVFCGKTTSNWWSIWTEDGKRKCKCRDCLKKHFH